jgi:MFS transporter, DHA2 family, methylenomycin A resistance protein
VLFYLSLFLQRVQGRSALDSGLVFLPLSGTMAISGPVAGRLTAAFGQRVIVVAGTVIAAAGVLSLAAISPDTSVASLAVRFAIAGVGMGLMAAPLSSAMIASLPSGSAGFASAMYNSSRQVGGVLGITLLGVILATRLHASTGQQALAFTSGVRLALFAAGLALVASAVTSGALIRGRPVPPPDEDEISNHRRARPQPDHAAVRVDGAVTRRPPADWDVRL